MISALVGGGAFLAGSVWMWYRRRRRGADEPEEELQIQIDATSDLERYAELLCSLEDMGLVVTRARVDRCDLLTIRCPPNDDVLDLWVSGPSYMHPLPRLRNRQAEESSPGVVVEADAHKLRRAIEEARLNGASC